MERPKPTITPASEPYWQSVSERALQLQRCDRCESFRFYPTPVCPSCGSTAFDWRPVSGRGTVYSWTAVHKPVTGAFASEVPYVVAMVVLEEGPAMMTNLVGIPLDEIEIGLSVRLDYREFDGGLTLPVWRPASDDEAAAG